MRLIVVRAPFRISFAGGGSDFPDYYQIHNGAVLSTAINKYVYIIVNPRDSIFDRGIRLSCTSMGDLLDEHAERESVPSKIRVSYSSTENVQKVDEIEHPIVRESLRLLNIQEPVDISTTADIPAGTGLGSSSTFAVALLHALHQFKSESVSPEQLVKEGAHVELNLLKRPMGKQDHCAAAFGGLNLFNFLPDDRVDVVSLHSRVNVSKLLFPSLMLFFTGIHRRSESILAEQKTNIDGRRNELRKMCEQAHQLTAQLINEFSAEMFGQVLHEAWLMKQKLSSGINTPHIEDLYQRARRAGAWGGKLCGAGGGGFLLVAVDPERKESIRRALPELQELAIEYEPLGSQVLLGGSSS